MSLASRIAYNTVVSIGGRAMGVALSLVSFGLIARYLGQEDFGSYALILAFLSVFNILADLGLYSLMTREISRTGADETKIVNNIFTLRIIALIISLLIAIGLVWFFPYSIKVKIGVALASITFLLLSASQVLMGIFQKHLRTDKVALAEIVGRAIQLGLIVLFVYLDAGFFALFGALIAGALLIFILNVVFARRYVPLSLAFDFSYWKEVLKTTIPIALAIVFTLIYFKIDSIFLSLSFINKASVNALADVGIYAVAYKILEGLIFFPAMLVGLIMPLLSKFAIANLVDFKRIFQKTLDVLILFVVPLMIGLIVLALPIVNLIGGDNFGPSAPVLQILSIAIGLIFFGNLFGSSIIALNKQKTAAWIYLGGMLFNIIANLIFIPKYSYLGAASTTVLTELLVTVAMLWLIIKTIKYLPSFKIFFKTIPAGLIMGVFIYYFQAINIILLAGLGLIIYIGILYSDFNTEP